MESVPFLRDLVILIAVAVPVVILMHRLRTPSLVGFLLSGVVMGPHALGLIRDAAVVNEIAQVGSVLLLFAVGLELSFSRIVRLGGYALRGGAIQMVGTMAIVAVVAMGFGQPANHAVLWGALIALSSTAIILKIYADRGELDSIHGRIAVAILLFQDLCVVPLMVLLPLLAGTEQGPTAMVRAVVVTIVVAGGITVAGKFIVPKLLERIVMLRNQEIFTLCVLAIGLGAAYLTSVFGLSLALGAFLAGLVMAESEYGLQALADVLPFRDTFMGIFFTSVGMLLDVRFFASHALVIVAVAAGIVLLKAVSGFLVVRLVQRSTRAGVTAGLGLAQVGEFSFVLASAALGLNLLNAVEYQVFLGAAILSMLAAPFLVSVAPALAEWLLRRRQMPTMEFTGVHSRFPAPLVSHVIIVGYGLNGRNLTRALRNADIPYAVLEYNGQVVRQARKENELIFFGDGTRAEVLQRVGIKRARVIVFAVASHEDEKRGIAVARSLNPAIHIVARTRYVRDVHELVTLGANEVVPEEFETSVEIFARVLRRFDVPEQEVRAEVETVRRDHYEVLRERVPEMTPAEEYLAPGELPSVVSDEHG